MTFDESKAWLKGFMDAIDGLPNEIQWKIIKKRFDDLKAEKEKVVEITKYIEKVKEVPALPYRSGNLPARDLHLNLPITMPIQPEWLCREVINPLITCSATNSTDNVVSLNPYVATI